MSNTNYTSSAHNKYCCKYHIIWCPKFRYNVLKTGNDEALKQILHDIANEYGYEIQALEIMPDHVHVFISTTPTTAPVDIVRTLKSKSAIALFKHNPQLKSFYSRCGALWSRGYFISTIGHISEDTVIKYIEEQKQHDK